MTASGSQIILYNDLFGCLKTENEERYNIIIIKIRSKILHELTHKKKLYIWLEKTHHLKPLRGSIGELQEKRMLKIHLDDCLNCELTCERFVDTANYPNFT